jgi:hypothetical protein
VKFGCSESGARDQFAILYRRARMIHPLSEKETFPFEWRRSARARVILLFRARSRLSSSFSFSFSSTCIDSSQCSPSSYYALPAPPSINAAVSSRALECHVAPARPYPPLLDFSTHRHGRSRSPRTQTEPEYTAIGTHTALLGSPRRTYSSPVHAHHNPPLELIKRCSRRLLDTQASAAFPENTLASFEAAIQDGAEGIETGTLPRPI